jgi:anti-sigma B factor antagonist
MRFATSSADFVGGYTMAGSLDSRPTEPTVVLRWVKPDIAIVVLEGEHDLASAASVDRVVGDALLTCSHLIIDIASADFIDSTIIDLLVRTKRDADSRGRRFNLVLGEAPLIEKPLEICGVLPSLNRVTDVHGALGSPPRDAGCAPAPGSERVEPLTGIRPGKAEAVG